MKERTIKIVAQVYIAYPEIADMPLKELKAFKKIPLAVGEAKTIQFSIALSELQKWDEATHAWKLNKGDYNIIIGENADDVKLHSTISVQ